MKRTTIAYVDSSRDRCKRYIVIWRGNRLECNCLSFFFAESRDEPCRHLKQLLKTTFDGDRVDHLKAVSLTPKGEKILRYRAERARRKAEAEAKSKEAA